jgi:sulfatase-like protein
LPPLGVRSRPRPLWIALLACAGCGAGEPQFPVDGVIHLDPRLEDGSSSAARLAERGTTWIEQLAIEGPGSDLGSWSLANAEAVATSAGEGVYLRGNVPVPGESKLQRIELRYAKTLDASAIDVLEIELGRTTRGGARVSWRAPGSDPAAVRPYVDAAVDYTEGRASVRVNLAEHPDWRGKIAELTVLPKQDGQQRFDLYALRLGRVGFVMGFDPLGAPHGDGGLIAQGRQTRRAWPIDWNVPLYAKVRVPSKGRLCVDTALTGVARELSDEVRFAIDARPAGGAWTLAGERQLARSQAAQATQAAQADWKPLQASLESWEGREIELRFTVERAASQSPAPSLEHAVAYWGAPMVVGAQPRDRRPNVLLITLDTVRADAIGILSKDPGHSRTPYLDRLAQRGLCFDNAWTACNATSPSHASILTGIAVQDHGLLDNRSILAGGNTTLAEVLREAGWHTAAAVSVEHLQAGKSGLGQGFDEFLLAGTDSSRDGAVTIRAVKDWLEEWHSRGDRPFFLWVHLFDAHTPYGPPAEYLDEYVRRFELQPPPRAATPANLPNTQWSRPGQFLEGVSNRAWPEFLYQAAVAYDDALVENLASELARLGWADSTAVAVIADHGEALGEHDNWYHHTSLYGEVMRVPLILALPGVAPRRVSDPAWSLDLARTLCAFTGTRATPEMRGANLLELGSAPARRIWFEHSELHQVGACDSDFYVIATLVDYEQRGRDRRIPKGTLEMFERADSAQLREVASSRQEAASAYRALIEQWRVSALQRDSLPSELSPEAEARLKSLGY